MSTTDLTRRTLLGSATTGAAALGGLVAPALAQTGGKTFVLVHGAWHGGWCWRRVADRLSAEGHKVFTPTMTGLGERSHLLDAKIGLATHITDIVNAIKWEGLAESLADIAPNIRARIAGAIQKGEFVLQPIPAAAFFVNEKDPAWVDSMCTPHPIATFADTSVVSGARDRIAKRSYIRAKGYPNAAFDGYQAQCTRTAGWRVHELPCGHDAMVDLPAELTDLLLTAA
jgi:hypothetical protein